MTLQQRVTLFVQSVGTDVKSILGKIGNLTTLTTTAKTDIVSAVNEIAANTTTNAVGEQFEIIDGEFRIKDSYLIAFGTAQGWGAGVPTPVASSVAFTGTQTQGQTLTGTYTYSGGTEGSSLPKWYRSDNASGLNRAAISGATASTYVLQAGDVGKYIQFAVTPVSNTPTTGTEVFSAYSGAIVASVATATNLTNFQLDGYTQSTNNLTSTKGNATAVARKSTDATTSTLGLKTFEIGYDASWSGEVAIGLGTPNYAGAGYNAVENAFYIPSNRALNRKVAGVGEASLGYTLPAASTSKVRIRAVEDTTFWRLFFEYSTDSGTSWTILNSGGTLSNIAKTTKLYGLIVAFSTATIFKDIKGDE